MTFVFVPSHSDGIFGAFSMLKGPFTSSLNLLGVRVLADVYYLFCTESLILREFPLLESLIRLDNPVCLADVMGKVHEWVLAVLLWAPCPCQQLIHG